MNRAMKHARQESTGPVTRAAKKNRARSPSPSPIANPPPPDSAAAPPVPHEDTDVVVAVGIKGTSAPLLEHSAIMAASGPVDMAAPGGQASAATLSITAVPDAAANATSAGALSQPTTSPDLRAVVVPTAVSAPAFAQVPEIVQQALAPSSGQTGVVAPVVSGDSGPVASASTPASLGQVSLEVPSELAGEVIAAAPTVAASNGQVETQQPASAVDSNLMLGAVPQIGSAAPPAQRALLPSADVPDPVPRPAVMFLELDYVPLEVFVRLRNIVRFRDVTSNRFAVTMVPRTADWGRAPRTEKILCIGGKPVLIWLVGRVRSLWFFDRNGDPHLRVNLGFTLHSAEESAAASELFGRARPRAESTPTTLYAGRICSQRERGAYCDTPAAFRQVYDATTCLTAKSAMPQLSPVELGKNDVVVVECTFTRWRHATEGKSKKSWSTFDVGFELMSIFLLYSAPADVSDGDNVDAVDEITAQL